MKMSLSGVSPTPMNYRYQGVAGSVRHEPPTKRFLIYDGH